MLEQYERWNSFKFKALNRYKFCRYVAGWPRIADSQPQRISTLYRSQSLIVTDDKSRPRVTRVGATLRRGRCAAQVAALSFHPTASLISVIQMQLYLMCANHQQPSKQLPLDYALQIKYYFLILYNLLSPFGRFLRSSPLALPA